MLVLRLARVQTQYEGPDWADTLHSISTWLPGGRMRVWGLVWLHSGLFASDRFQAAMATEQMRHTRNITTLVCKISETTKF